MTDRNRSQKDQKLGQFAKFLILAGFFRSPTLRGFFDKRTISEQEALTVMNRELLERPFSAEQIKQRKGSFGDVLDYIEGATVIQRLNDCFEGEWMTLIPPAELASRICSAHSTTLVS